MTNAILRKKVKIIDAFTSPITITIQCQFLTMLKKKAFENIVGKGENAGNQHFLLFPQYFTPIPNQISLFELHLFCHSKKETL